MFKIISLTMVLEEMVEARSDFAKKRSLRENKTPPNWNIFFTKTHIFFINFNKCELALHIFYWNFNFLPKKFVNYHKIKKREIKNLPNINKIVHISLVLDFKFLQKSKTIILKIVEQSLYPTHSTNFLFFLNFLQFFHYFTTQKMFMGPFFGKFKNLASTILLIPCYDV